jgi:hypothetical protein
MNYTSSTKNAILSSFSLSIVDGLSALDVRVCGPWRKQRVESSRVPDTSAMTRIAYSSALSWRVGSILCRLTHADHSTFRSLTRVLLTAAV